MVRHIVLFQLKKMESESAKLEVMNAFKNAIEALPKDINVIRSIEVKFNMNPAEIYDIALNSEFDSLEDVNIYAKHPLHVAAGKILADVKESRACVDYEF